MGSPEDNDSLRIEAATENEKEAVYDFMCRAFFPFEPICSTTGVTFPIYDCFAVKDLDQGYSLKTVDREGNIVAMAVNVDNEKIPKNAEPPRTEFMKKLTNFFDYCDVKSGVHDLEGYLVLHVLAVDPAWKRKGLGGQLVARTEELAKSRGFSGVYTICTSRFTADAVRRRGWRLAFSEPYAEYKESGQPVFPPPPEPHTNFAVYIIDF